MDVKGITWFGTVCQKFETMCLEVEEAVCQDTVKYVENQVQTVGASVKKFYSEVVDDLLSPSVMDPVKVNSLSCIGAHKKPKMGSKEEPKKQLFDERNATLKRNKNQTDAPSFDRFLNTDPAVLCNPVSSTIASKSVGVSPKKLNLVIKRKPKTVLQNSSEALKETNPGASVPDKETVISSALTIDNNGAPTDQIFGQQLKPNAVSWDSKETIGNKTGDGNQDDFKPKQIADASAKHAKIILPDGTGTRHPKNSVFCRSSENEHTFKPMLPADAFNEFTNIPPSDTSADSNDTVTYEAPYADADTVNKDASGFNNSNSEEWTAQTEATDGWNIETITSDDDDDDVIDAGTEIMDINFNSHTALDESCIVVHRDNIPFCSHKEPKLKSYKKKLREAFASRGKSTLKKEYRQLAAQYESTTCLEELEQHCSSSSIHTSTLTSEERKLKSRAQLCDLEWEIL